MVYQVPASKASIKQNKFEFKVGTTTHSLPKFKFLPLSVIETIEGSDESVTAYLSIFGEKGTPVGDAIRSLDTDQFTNLIKAWRDDSGIEPGESVAS